MSGDLLHKTDPESVIASIEGLDEVRRVKGALRDAGVAEAYLVGGLVRDLFFNGNGVYSEAAGKLDIDVAVPAVDRALVGRLAGSLGASAFCLDERNSAWRLALDAKRQVDVVGYRGAGILEDLRGRDFTVNAIAYDLVGARGLYDPLGGISALGKGELRLCSDAVLADDPLRVLRAYRFIGTMGLELAPGLESLTARHATALGKVAAERIRDEIFRMLGGPHGGRALRLAVSHGVWGALFPFISEWRGFDQGSYHAHDLLEHSLRAVGYVEWILESARFGEVTGALRAHLSEEVEAGVTRLSLVKWIAFFHDVEKPATLTVESSGRRRFIGHDLKGGKRAAGLLAALKVGRKARRMTEAVIGAHMRLFGLAHQSTPTMRSRQRYLCDLEDGAPESVLLSLADELATGNRSDEERECLWRTGAEILELYFNPVEQAELLLRGRDLMGELGLREGREIGRVLKAVAEAETEGRVSSREEALEYARSMMSRT